MSDGLAYIQKAKKFAESNPQSKKIDWKGA